MLAIRGVSSAMTSPLKMDYRQSQREGRIQ
jgi:hypothetical protein